MKIYNTLTKRKEEFVPLEEGKVKDVYKRQLIGSRRIQRGTYRSAGSAENGLKESGPKTSSERPQYGPVTPLSSE